MKSLGAVAVAMLMLGLPPALAQTSTGAQKMSEADCTAAWSKLDAAKSDSVTQTQAQGTLTDFKAADTNNDGKLTQVEFKAACDKGLVTAAAGTGAGSRGITGSDKK